MARISRSNTTSRQRHLYLPSPFFLIICFAVIFVLAILSAWSASHLQSVALNEALSDEATAKGKNDIIKLAPVENGQFPQLRKKIKPAGIPSDLARRVVFEVENLDSNLGGSSAGRIVVQLHPEWSPLGVVRFVVG